MISDWKKAFFSWYELKGHKRKINHIDYTKIYYICLAKTNKQTVKQRVNWKCIYNSEAMANTFNLFKELCKDHLQIYKINNLV